MVLQGVNPAGYQPYAFVGGVFLGKDVFALVQALFGRAGTSWYYRYPLDAFHADADTFDVRIGKITSTQAVSSWTSTSR